MFVPMTCTTTDDCSFGRHLALRTIVEKEFSVLLQAVQQRKQVCGCGCGCGWVGVSRDQVMQWLLELVVSL